MLKTEKRGDLMGTVTVFWNLEKRLDKKSRTEQWFESGRREKMLRRWSYKDETIKFDEVGEDLRILDVGSCNGNGFLFLLKGVPDGNSS